MKKVGLKRERHVCGNEGHNEAKKRCAALILLGEMKRIVGFLCSFGKWSDHHFIFILPLPAQEGKE